MNFVKSLLATNLNDLTGEVSGWVTAFKNIATTILGLIVFALVGLAAYLAYKLFTADDENKRKNAKMQLIYAIIGLAVMVVLLVMVPTITKAISTAINDTNIK